eukprot:5688579-Pleurochrysis_carterae.AAC.8
MLQLVGSNEVAKRGLACLGGAVGLQLVKARLKRVEFVCSGGWVVCEAAAIAGLGKLFAVKGCVGTNATCLRRSAVVALSTCKLEGFQGFYC